MSKFRQLLIICLVLTALGTILLPMQVEQPLFFFKSSAVDDNMFAQPLINLKQVFSDERMHFANARAKTTKHVQEAFNKVFKRPNEKLPEAWALKVAETCSKSSAIHQVDALLQKGLPAYYHFQDMCYWVMVGPEVNFNTIRTWQRQIAKAELNPIITLYQPA